MRKNNTGKQIQNLAYLLCGLGCFAFIIGGLVYFVADNIFAGIIIAAIGCYISWASTRCLKGFGELVEDTAANREINEQILDVLESMYTRELEADAVKYTAAPPSDEPVSVEESKPVFVEKTYPSSAKKKEEKHNPLLNGLVISVILLFVLIIIGVASSSTYTPSATAKPTKKVVVTAVPTKTPYISATPKRTTKATAKPTATATATPTPTPTNSPAPTLEATAFTVEHDAEYQATQGYIYKFLTEKGYEVQTIIGVPNIGRYEDADPDDLSVPWYAYVKHNGDWTEFVVTLYGGEVSSIRPNK